MSHTHPSVLIHQVIEICWGLNPDWSFNLRVFAHKDKHRETVNMVTFVSDVAIILCPPAHPINWNEANLDVFILINICAAIAETSCPFRLPTAVCMISMSARLAVQKIPGSTEEVNAAVLDRGDESVLPKRGQVQVRPIIRSKNG